MYKFNVSEKCIKVVEKLLTNWNKLVIIKSIKETVVKFKHKGAKNMIYGYARVSTVKQNIDRQIRNIKEFEPNALMIQEKYS